MQCSQHLDFPPFFPSFRRHRSSIDHLKFRLDLTLPTLPSAPVWASLPTPPMSGSPPPDQPLDPQQIAGRRRKRSESLPPATTGVVSAYPTSPQQGLPAYGLPSTSDQPSYLPQQGPASTSAYPAPPPTAMAYAAGPAIAVPATSPTDSRYPGGQVSPRTARKTKAHVASACINCKKKHLRCDNARPCRRCVQSGKEVCFF